MLLICYAKCGTCRKAKKWLEENSVPFEERPIKEQNPTREELAKWQSLSGLPLKKFFNTSGTLYREMGLSVKLKTMSEEEMLDLLATDGMLVKRPLVVQGDTVLVGFQEEQWREKLL